MIINRLPTKICPWLRGSNSFWQVPVDVTAYFLFLPRPLLPLPEEGLSAGPAAMLICPSWISLRASGSRSSTRCCVSRWNITSRSCSCNSTIVASLRSPAGEQQKIHTGNIFTLCTSKSMWTVLFFVVCVFLNKITQTTANIITKYYSGLIWSRSDRHSIKFH